MANQVDEPPAEPVPRQLTRREHARKEAYVGAVSGALLGLALWRIVEVSTSAFIWILPFALLGALAFYQNEWQD